MDTQEIVNVLLDRCVRQGVRADKMQVQLQRAIQEANDIRTRLAARIDDHRRHERDMKVAVAKLEEWAEYAATLRAMLKTRKVLDEKLPNKPGPFETEILF